MGVPLRVGKDRKSADCAWSPSSSALLTSKLHCRHSFFHSNRSFNAKFRSNSVQKSRIVQFGTLWHSKAVHGLNLQASAANLHIVKILRDIEGSFYNSYGIQGLEMTFWALYFHTPICHSVL